MPSIKTYKYSFYVVTPNAKNATGPILSSPFHQFTYEDGTKVWRPGETLYKEKDDVFAYQQFVKSHLSYCGILIEVVSLTGDENPLLLDFHNEIREVNRMEEKRRMQWLKSSNPTPYFSMLLKDARYVVGEDLSTFLPLPYVKDIRGQKPQIMTGIYTPQ